jgi:membrane-anchored protein YejM (alkaline phosphatase superfamily)
MYELTIKQKLNNYFYFVISSSLIALLLGVVYFFPRVTEFHISNPPTDFLTISFIVSKYVSHMLLLCLLFSVIGLPSIWMQYKSGRIFQSIIASIGIIILLADGRIFRTGFIHLLNIDITRLQQDFINGNITIPAVYLITPLLVMLIFWLNNKIATTNFFIKYRVGRKFITITLLAVIVANIIYYSSSEYRKLELQASVQNLPFLVANGKIADKLTQAYNYRKSNKKIQYPVNPLITTAIANPPNVLIIAIDAWRYDCFNEQDSPNLWKFAQQGTVFNNHKSAANRTYFSLFSMFYGIPSSYMDLLINNQVPSILISRLLELDYQINYFTSWKQAENAYFMHPIFNNIDNLYTVTSGDTQYIRDSNITNDWLNWYNNLNKTKPWFSFIFYDSLHGPDFPEGYSTTAQAAGTKYKYKQFVNMIGKEQFTNSYKTSVHYMDSLAKKILQKLANEQDLSNTIVVITSDHGCELNDNSQGMWGYGTNFTNCQLKVPFAIVGPKFNNNINNSTTSISNHFDLVPTLMQEFLGVTNDTRDYSIGTNLLNKAAERTWSFATSAVLYHNESYAIVDNTQQCIRFLPQNKYWVLNKHNKRILHHNPINYNHVEQALEYITRFIKK